MSFVYRFPSAYCFKCSKIQFILLAQDQAGAELSNIWDYQTVATLMQVFASMCMLLLLYLVCTPNQRGITFRYLHHHLVQGHQGSLLCCFQVFIAVKVDQGVRKCHSGSCTDAAGCLLEHVTEMFLFCCQCYFSVKTQNLWSWDYSVQVPDYWTLV